MKDICNEILGDDYKQILLGVMDAIDSYCRTHSITYYLVGGTLLGAVRHKGFIPWDDDIDIAMKRSDYERFCLEFNSDRKDNYKVVGLHNMKSYYTSSAKVIDTSTSLLENAFQAVELGAYIDVFPLDYISADNLGKAEQLLCKKTLALKVKSVKTMNISSSRSWLKNGLIVASRVLCWSSINKISQDYDRRAKKIAGTSNDAYIANLYGAWGKREISESKYFDSIVELPFEGRLYMAPCGYKMYLQGVYGDYMKLPPKEKQVAHHDFKVYWKEGR
ncbi:lipopolysaccharide cholinephosphotransferase [Kandleria vitulina]|uniref:Lipopolysaccharide cholinephosphotransferase n=1 Tax=Kandleria vitulina TaxID=1630 RepID=A0A1H2VN81_9FIRM|nr:LicD family protein [Kandleria vitulina]SDW69793.1 lipopolysaccharide cholinephosphotransferase [Kandleria vitulina]